MTSIIGLIILTLGGEGRGGGEVALKKNNQTKKKWPTGGACELLTSRDMAKPKLQRDDYHLLSRKQQVILVRLRTGHNRLNSHMHRKLKLAPSPTCPCGREEQTVEHVLQRCPLYEATREDVWPVSTSLTTKLYGCRQELEKTTSFISRAALIV